MQALTINANDQVTSADQYRTLIVADRNGVLVRLSDVATIVSGRNTTSLPLGEHDTRDHHQ